MYSMVKVQNPRWIHRGTSPTHCSKGHAQWIVSPSDLGKYEHVLLPQSFQSFRIATYIRISYSLAVDEVVASN